MPSLLLPLLLALALAACACAAAPAAPGNASAPLSGSKCVIQSYVFALQHACGFESIHGLWPDPADTCTSCTSEAFSTSKLSSSTLSGMQKYWPTCQSGSNEDFWSHEWSKHGTCTGMTQDGYFSKALSLFSSYSSKCNGNTGNCNLCFSSTFSYQGTSC